MDGRLVLAQLGPHPELLAVGGMGGLSFFPYGFSIGLLGLPHDMEAGFKKKCSKRGSRSYQFLKAQSKKTVYLLSYSIGQNHLSPSGWRCRSHLSRSGLPKNSWPSLFHHMVCDKKCRKTTNLGKQNVYQQLNPQTRAQLSHIRNSWASEVGLLSLVHLLKAVHQKWAQVYSLNDFFTPKA